MVCRVLLLIPCPFFPRSERLQEPSEAAAAQVFTARDHALHARPGFGAGSGAWPLVGHFWLPFFGRMGDEEQGPMNWLKGEGLSWINLVGVPGLYSGVLPSRQWIHAPSCRQLLPSCRLPVGSFHCVPGTGNQSTMFTRPVHQSRP